MRYHKVMKNSVSKIPAYLVLRLISLFLAVIGSAFLSFAGKTFLSIAPISGQHGVALLIGGILLLFIGVVGPARIICKGAKIPAEIKQTILIHALVLPISGFIFIFSGIFNTPTSEAWAFFGAGLSILVSALVGFYALSKKLPHTFYIGEMLNIIKSAGISGDKKNSPADREFLRWTKGVRNGVLVDEAAPDGMVITMEGEAVLLSSFFGKNHSSPLVLNFGSYTCPHHRKRINELHSLMGKWQTRGVQFLTVYTAEAHPEDGWKLAHQYDNDVEYTNEEDFCFYSAKSIDDRRKMFFDIVTDRRKMCKWLIERKHFKMPIVLDSIKNGLLKAYNSWPIRLYIINDGKVAYCGKQGPFGYDPGSVDRALQNLPYN